jgi:uncharacterized protein YgiM (DUF1202 family)
LGNFTYLSVMKALKHRLSCYSLPLALLLLLITGQAFAQQTTYYSIADPELSLRQGPGTQSAVLTKIPYGSKIEFAANDSNSYQQVVIGGFPSYWKKVKYKEHTGYVISAYLSDMAPPKTGIKDLPAFASKVSQPFGTKLVKGKTPVNIDEGDVSITRQLYKNGLAYTLVSGYEYQAETLQFPSQDIAVVYNLLKNIDEFASVIKTNSDLKEGEHTTKDSKGIVYTWKVTYEKENGMQWLTAIKITWEEGGYYNLSIQALETEVIVTYSSGV